MIYDMMALEWSDDSLFCFTLFSQAIGIFIGLPIASMIYILSLYIYSTY